MFSFLKFPFPHLRGSAARASVTARWTWAPMNVSIRALSTARDKFYRGDFNPELPVQGAVLHRFRNKGAIISSSFRPQVIVFGGQIAKAFSLFEISLRKAVDQAALPAKLIRCKLGNAAGLYGVAELFLS